MKLTALILLIISACFQLQGQVVLITNFSSATGNNNFDLNPSHGYWTLNQGLNSVSVSNVSNQGYGIFSSLTTPTDITADLSAPLLQLTGQLTSPTPTQDKFNIVLTDSTGNDSLTYRFQWSSFAGSSQTITSSVFSSSGIFNGTVKYYEVDLFGVGSDPVNTLSFTFDNLQVTPVPESPAWPFLVAGAGAALFFFRRRKHLAELVKV